MTVRNRSWCEFASKMSFAKCILANFFALMHFVFIILQKCAPRLSGKHIFENQLWAIGLQNFTFWSIEGFKWSLIRPSFWHVSLLNFFFRRFSASVAHPNFEKSSAKRVIFAQGAVLQNDMIYHTCNFVTFWWLMPFAVCFWWLHTHFFAKMLSQFAFFVFLQKCAPRWSGKHIFESQLWAIRLQTSTFWNIEGLR